MKGKSVKINDEMLKKWASLRESEKFEKIDDIVKWCDSQNLEWVEVEKFRKIHARKAKEGEKIQTTLSDGTKETDERTAHEGDWIVGNVDGGGEEWIVTDKNFQKKYEKTSKAGIFKPKENPMLAVQLDKPIEFKPPMWGGDAQRVNAGGHLLRDQKNKNDIYGIGEKEFHDTYRETR